jgi:hypothetical protein
MLPRSQKAAQRYAATHCPARTDHASRCTKRAEERHSPVAQNPGKGRAPYRMAHVLQCPTHARVEFPRHLRNRATSAPRTSGAALPQLVRSWLRTAARSSSFRISLKAGMGEAYLTRRASDSVDPRARRGRHDFMAVTREHRDKLGPDEPAATTNNDDLHPAPHVSSQVLRIGAFVLPTTDQQVSR